MLILPLLAPFLPGLLLAFYLIKEIKISLLLLLLYTAMLGIAFQMGVGILASAIFWLNIGVKYQFIATYIVLLIAIVFITKSFRKNWWINQWRKIDFSAYDYAAIILTIVILSLISRQIAFMGKSNFLNPATDQYFWLAYSKNFIYHTPQIISPFFNIFTIFKPTFFIFLAPYLPFIKDSLEALQQLIIFQLYLFTALWSLALIQLARLVLPAPSLGLLAPLILFTYHFSNYFTISIGLAGQTVAIFLFIMGFIIMHYQPNPIIYLLFTLTLYLIHFPTLVMFLIVMGVFLFFKRITNYAFS